MKRLLGLLLVMGMVGCGIPRIQMRSASAQKEQDCRLRRTLTAGPTRRRFRRVHRRMPERQTGDRRRRSRQESSP